MWVQCGLYVTHYVPPQIMKNHDIRPTIDLLIKEYRALKKRLG